MVFNPTSVFYLVLHHQHPRPPSRRTHHHHHNQQQHVPPFNPSRSYSDSVSSASSSFSEETEPINSQLLLSTSPEFDSPCQQQGTITATVSEYLNHQESATGKTRSSSVEDGQPAVISLRQGQQANRSKSEEGTSASGIPSASAAESSASSFQAGEDSSTDSMKPKMPQLQIKLGLAVFKPPHELWCQVGDLIEIDRTLYSCKSSLTFALAFLCVYVTRTPDSHLVFLEEPLIRLNDQLDLLPSLLIYLFPLLPSIHSPAQ